MSRAVTVVLLLVPAGVVTWAFRPGYMNADTILQYNTTQGGRLDDWYAPVLQQLWDAGVAVGLGAPTDVLFAQTLALTLGMYLVLRAAASRVVAALVSVALIFAPPVLAQVMLLGRDTWLACLVTLQAGCSIRWARTPGWRGRAWLAASLASGFLAVASRQNAAPLVLVVLVATVHRWLAARDGSSARWHGWRTRLLSLAGATAAVVVMAASIGVLVSRVFDAFDRQPEAVLFGYDLAGMSVHEDALLLGPEAFPAQDLDQLRRLWNPQNVLSVLLPPEQGGLQATVGPVPADELSRDWRREVPAHLGSYLSVRWTVFTMMIGVSERPTVVVHPGVDGNGWGYEIENPGANRWFRSYLRVLATDDTLIYGSELSRPIWYLAIAAGSAAFLLRRAQRRRAGGLEVGLLAVGALVYEAAFFVAAVGENYRYSYPSITLGLLAGAFVVLTVVRDRRERPPSGSFELGAADEPSGSDDATTSPDSSVPAGRDSTTDGSSPRSEAATAATTMSVSKQTGTANEM